MWIMRERSIAEIARRNRQELVEARVSRRDLLKMGLLGSGGLLVVKHGLSGRAHASEAPSPPTRPFAQPLPLPPTKQPVAILNPTPQALPQTALGESRLERHVAFERFSPQMLYELRIKEGLHRFHPDMPPSPIWGYDGIFPGPTFRSRYGAPAIVRNVNELPQDHVGYGIPQVSTHLHNAHNPSTSDGFACNYFPQQAGGADRWYDYHYPHARAGFSSPQYGPAGDPRESQGTLWYHDHKVDFTSPNVYRGLAGFYIMSDERDTGGPDNAWRLPWGEFDVPMVFQDRLFDPDGQLYYDLFNFDGQVGDKMVVNGAIQPSFQVQARRYRFRWLAGGPARFWQFHLTDLANPSRRLPFQVIAADGNLLPQSYELTNVRLSVAERADVIIDFSQFPPGTSIYLENRLEQKSGNGPTENILPAGQGDLLVRFDVVPAITADDSAPGPYVFYPAPRPSAAELAAAKVRTWRFERRRGMWSVNGQIFDCDTPAAQIPEGSGEVWVFQNNSGGWQHPIHVHFEEFMVLERNGGPPPPFERGRKDVARLGYGNEVKMFMRFRDFTGRYMMHCHNSTHEDHAMMVRWDIVPR